MTRSHLQLTQRRTLPLGLASNGTDRVVYNDQPANLTLLEQDHSCTNCPWPTVCEQDRTCWHAETARASEWQRSHIDLPRTNRAGPNTWTRQDILHAVQAYHQRHGRSPGAADMKPPHMPSLNSIYRFFHTVNQLQDAAGVPRTRRGWRNETSTNLNQPQPKVETMPANPHPALFDPDRTQPATCPHCQAMRLPGQAKALLCAHDLDGEPRRRPKHCLNAHDPATAPLPEGY